ncbi:hydrogenase maturation nickel metallochaperone HypA [Thioalkalivibrio sulfidiphilus]|uniref:Hydrogenase maturation factor HypA n=1 Tax=Thioalkalivibrio sulfidiphilus (strain HL-EbGR7) TaxID=396588 RepID=B8GQG4_THISH|nr:hydrogenase maturation nickel metallochaperone HypA [Thioalkalivibrio sulfidiphilus]ACL72359.1 hydrogenase expression/synthesis HypA [Thioalkalivibrio sulfidiphilus HL-EbGr7]
MHELAVCQSVIRQAEAVAREHGARGITRIRLRIGVLSGVEPELLARAFPLAQAGTLAEGASLEMESLPVRVVCNRCEAESEVPANRLLCGVCGDWQTRVISGEEMLLESLELVTAEEGEHV